MFPTSEKCPVGTEPIWYVSVSNCMKSLVSFKAENSPRRVEAMISLRGM